MCLPQKVKALHNPLMLQDKKQKDFEPLVQSNWESNNMSIVLLASSIRPRIALSKTKIKKKKW